MALSRSQDRELVIEGPTPRQEGEAAASGQPTVLSCGGIYIRRARLPLHLKKWRQIVHTVGGNETARIFGIDPIAEPDFFSKLQLKEGMN